MGTGRSKKEAKHAAAKAVLDKLIGVNTESADAPLPNSIPEYVLSSSRNHYPRLKLYAIKNKIQIY